MSMKIEELKKVMETLETTKGEIEKKYSQLQEKIQETDNKLKPLDLHITRLKEELAEVDPKDTQLVAEYERQIKESLESEERQGLLKEKEELVKQVAENKLDNDKNKKIELTQADDAVRKTLTQEKIKMENELASIDAEMQVQLAAMRNFKYEYEEKDGIRVATNGMEMKAINDKYAELTDAKRELKEAIKYCEDELEKFRQKDQEKVAKMSEIMNELKREMENEKTQTPEVEEPAQEPVVEETTVAQEPVVETPAVETPVVEMSEVGPKLETPKVEKTVEETTATNDINEEELNKIKMAVKEMRALGLDDEQIISHFYPYDAGKITPMELLDTVSEILAKYGISDIINSGLKSKWNRNFDEYAKYNNLITRGMEPEHEKRESFWERLNRFVDEHQEEIESEQSAEEVPVVEEPVVEGPKLEQPAIKEPVVEEPKSEQPVVKEPVVEEPTLPKPITQKVKVDIPEQEELKPIQSFNIKISKNGAKLKVIREGDKIGTVRYDNIDTIYDEYEMDAFNDFRFLNRHLISEIGDTIAVNAIASGVSTGLLTFEEGEEQLKNYLGLLTWEKEKEEVPLQLEYNLKGIKRSETYSKEGQERIIKEAKEARDLKIAKVKPGFWIGAKWAIQDFASKFGIKLWNKNKGITDGTEHIMDAEYDEIESVFGELENEQPSQETVAYDRLGNRITKTEQEKDSDEKLFGNSKEQQAEIDSEMSDSIISQIEDAGDR